ncbi:hypothetical protein H5968_21255 [Sphaerospermopsis sp. LEGE 00249]|uniref:hypothetical protein n=1 Tax=Sphaerospermopsis sp. LEGE 00249 TaxID=1380707 RepID=UPI00164DD8B4|nr:hypothetical protein [Sphaerospermopsis sp. LEGE 00249]MBC5797606.1 hypothetical protein [Sphaerospermopsis sp. LEGE 00249]
MILYGFPPLPPLPPLLPLLSSQSPVTHPQSPLPITYSDTNPVTICKETYSAAWRK